MPFCLITCLIDLRSQLWVIQAWRLFKLTRVEGRCFDNLHLSQIDDYIYTQHISLIRYKYVRVEYCTLIFYSVFNLHSLKKHRFFSVKQILIPAFLKTVGFPFSGIFSIPHAPEFSIPLPSSFFIPFLTASLILIQNSKIL